MQLSIFMLPHTQHNGLPFFSQNNWAGSGCEYIQMFNNFFFPWRRKNADYLSLLYLTLCNCVAVLGIWLDAAILFTQLFTSLPIVCYMSFTLFYSTLFYARRMRRSLGLLQMVYLLKWWGPIFVLVSIYTSSGSHAQCKFWIIYFQRIGCFMLLLNVCETRLH